jgi:rubrerythrin
MLSFVIIFSRKQHLNIQPKRYTIPESHFGANENKEAAMVQDGPDYEVLELAIHREVEAYRFYMAVAQRVDPEMRQVLEDFAEEELEHKAKLELEVLKIGYTLQTDNQLPAPSIDNYIISDTDSLLNMDYKDILVLAIEKEEASFRTYINLLPTVNDRQSRETLLAIAQEEAKHKHRFEIEYDQLLKKS